MKQIITRYVEGQGTSHDSDRLVAETNARLQRQAPALGKQHKGLQKALAEVKGTAGKLLEEWTALEQTEGRQFLSEKLSELARRRAELEQGLFEVEEAQTRLKREAVSGVEIRKALADISAVYQTLRPYEQRELIRLVLHKAEVADKQIMLEINGNVCGVKPQTLREEESRFERTNWLPDEDSNLEPSG